MLPPHRTALSRDMPRSPPLRQVPRAVRFRPASTARLALPPPRRPRSALDPPRGSRSTLALRCARPELCHPRSCPAMRPDPSTPRPAMPARARHGRRRCFAGQVADVVASPSITASRPLRHSGCAARNVSCALGASSFHCGAMQRDRSCRACARSRGETGSPRESVSPAPRAACATASIRPPS